MAYVVAATWIARPGEEERVAAAIRQLAEPSRAEPGCRFYQPTREPQDPRRFLLFEIYDDEAAFTAHHRSAHFEQHARGEAIPLLETRRIEVYETLD